MPSHDYTWIKNLSEEGLILLKKESYETQELYQEISKIRNDTLEELKKEEDLLERIKRLKFELDMIQKEIDSILSYLDSSLDLNKEINDKEICTKLQNIHHILTRNKEEILNIKNDLNNLKNKNHQNKELTQHIEQEVDQFQSYLERVEKLLDFSTDNTRSNQKK